MDRASETAGELRSFSGNSRMCCVARAEPAGGKESINSKQKQVSGELLQIMTNILNRMFYLII